MDHGQFSITLHPVIHQTHDNLYVLDPQKLATLAFFFFFFLNEAKDRAGAFPGIPARVGPSQEGYSSSHSRAISDETVLGSRRERRRRGRGGLGRGGQRISVNLEDLA